MKPYYKNELTTIYNGDCLEVMDYLIEQGVKFDAIITDPPYGTTACKWDNVIPFDKMWDRLKKLRKNNIPILLFGAEPFSSYMRISNIEEYKHDWIWHKSKALGFTNAKNKPLIQHELVSLFSNGNTANGTKNKVPYYPQGIIKYNKIVSGIKDCKADREDGAHKFSRKSHKKQHLQEYTNYPTQIIKYNNEYTTEHPTQKPVALLQYLIKTYTKENDLILDFTAGSFTTCVAAEQLNRRSIGIELEKKYCDIGVKRLNNLQMKFDI
jgi:site-specific DNA-methyltransferase (adenine-specific)